MKKFFPLYGARLRTLAVLGALMLNATVATSATFITSKVNGDDQFKIYISTNTTVSVQPEGFQYANGLGWPFTFSNTLYLPQDPNTGANYHDYWLNIWVRDEGGGGPVLLGQFKLTAIPGAGSPSYGSVAGCKFDNNSIIIRTSDTPLWKVTGPLPLSPSPAAPAGYPAYSSNYLPPWVQPTLIPTSLGSNGVGPWGLRSGISSLAKWITTTPPYANYTEAWFSTHIRCP